MEIKSAQQEVRSVFWGGSVGQAVSGIIWLISAALATWASPQAGVLMLVLGGIFIFPLTQLILKIMGLKASLSKGNPFNALAMQVAFIVPLCIPLILVVNRSDPNLFYPAFMIVVGAHYLPFMTLYGMRQYGALAAALLGGGVAMGMLFPQQFTPGGWFTGAVLVLFALIAWRMTAANRPGILKESLER